MLSPAIHAGKFCVMQSLSVSLSVTQLLLDYLFRHSLPSLPLSLFVCVFPSLSLWHLCVSLPLLSVFLSPSFLSLNLPQSPSVALSFSPSLSACLSISLSLLAKSARSPSVSRSSCLQQSSVTFTRLRSAALHVPARRQAGKDFVPKSTRGRSCSPSEHGNSHET